MFGKRITAFVLLTSLLSVNLLPIFAETAQAQFGGITHDPILTGVVSAGIGYDTGKKVADSFAMIAARLAIQQVVNSTVKWAQGGFNGNPAYATDPKQYFTDLGDNIAGGFIEGTDLNFLCSPFQNQIRLSLRNQYLEQPQFMCSLSSVIEDIDAFYNSFDEGGWDAWFAVTQNSANNPYGAYLETELALNSKLAEEVGLKQEQLQWDNGFLSQQVCAERSRSGEVTIDEYGQIGDYVPPPGESYEGGDCIRYKTVTPGSVIKEQLDRVLPSGLESLVTVNHVEQLIQAFAVGLLNRYVFNSNGLFSGGSGLPTDNPKGYGAGAGLEAVGVDVDGDNKNDIIDTDGDGQVDTCIYGGTYPSCLAGSANASTTAATIWGYVFEDTNGNGVRNTGEPTPSGVVVSLKSEDGSSDLGISQT
ncbi:MAG: hypothetical protein AAB758_00150, partial [Patescibacteria group bacterium]